MEPGTEGMAQAVEHLPSMFGALTSSLKSQYCLGEKKENKKLQKWSPRHRPHSPNQGY
jgi:hypothetical protein